MKNILSVVSLIILCAPLAYSQLDESKMILGGRGAFSAETGSSSFFINPEMGYIRKPDFVLVLSGNLNYSISASMSTWHAELGFRKYYWLNEKIPIFIHFQPGIYTSDDTFGGEFSPNFGIAAKAGFTYKFHDRWLLSIDAAQTKIQAGDLNQFTLFAFPSNLSFHWLIR